MPGNRMNPTPWEPSLGANSLSEDRCRFLVWAPFAKTVQVQIDASSQRTIPLTRQDRGYFCAEVEGISRDALYFYLLDEKKKRPDPASRYQPRGVHGPSQVKALRSFDWGDAAWAGLSLEQMIFYEIHVGTFTPEGTFDAIIPRLHELKDLGITAIELMPVAQFPGARNWGYDGVYPFAVQDSYGGPEGLKRIVNACHSAGLGVALDVVYNHLGPEGNYLADFGPYFTDRYRTVWGEAINFDGPGSDEVRRFFIENALYWISEFHIDALRLDAIHAIVDASALPFLEELSSAVHEEAARLGRKILVIAESDRNDARVIRPPESGGMGLDAQWNDDFHHAVHAALTGERNGYYADFGGIAQLGKAFTEGFVYSGQYSVYRQRRHGNSAKDVPAQRFLVFAQNHDQVGNRMLGERLHQLVSLEAVKLAAGLVIFSPFLPLLFMGEEYAEPAPFQYFINHSDPDLIENVRKGRREEFAAFNWQGELPDPQDEATYLRSKLHWEKRNEGRSKALLEFYKEILRLRRSLPALANLSKRDITATVFEREHALFIQRWCGEDRIFAAFNLGDSPALLSYPAPPGSWKKVIESCDERWAGAGSSAPDHLGSSSPVSFTAQPKSFSLYRAG